MGSRRTPEPDVPAALPPVWTSDLGTLLAAIGSRPAGLTGAEAAERLERDGPNQVASVRRLRSVRLLLSQFTSPIVLILVGATLLSMLLGDLTDGAIILVIVLASGLLGFWQERGAGRSVEALLAQVQVAADVLRDGREVAVPIDAVVVGDVVVLRAGDVVPADCRLLEAHRLLVDESALTGESFAVEKLAEPPAAEADDERPPDAVFLGTHVASGSATAVVVATGGRTQFGALAVELASRDVVTGFERGMTGFGLLLVRAMLVLVSAIFVVNVVLHRPLIDSLLFSLALAVGLTPQLLPAIVAVSLASGARRMAAERVVVKRLDAIEDFGAMTVLCTDKTGTLTEGTPRLLHAEAVGGQPSSVLLDLARLNAGLQHGFNNPLDDALLVGAAPPDPSRRLDEIPYDFTRKRLSVLALVDDHPTLVTKGALASVMEVCTSVEQDAATVPIEAAREVVENRFEALSADGLRVLGLATRALPGRTHVLLDDESGLCLRGLLVFEDPVKAGAAAAVAELAALGVSVRLVTGDNRHAAAHVARQVALADTRLLTGEDIDALDDEGLARAVAGTSVVAEVGPLHKKRILSALRGNDGTVGFLGDGINDTAALHAADVGISVDSAVDVAKQTADIVLLAKGLDVVADGVRMGRGTFANTLKYVRVTTSANFGNMLSMAAAAAFLPFLPLLPRQILLLNLLSDIPATTIAADSVDPEQVQQPHQWDIRGIRRFMVSYGSLSSVFDLLTFAVLWWGFDAGARLFRSGWFVESTATELAVMLVLRTSRPFWQSRPARVLVLSSAGVAALTLALPYSPLAGPLGLVALPLSVVAALVVLTTGYVAANELVKRRVPVAG